jgi:sugar phosphate isomerase/epimerase
MSLPLLSTGFCSVTFRKLPVPEIVALAKRAGLDAIEWGGDVHAPPTLPAGGLEEIAAHTRDAGLAVSSYGSYFRMGEHPEEAIGPVLEAAVRLGTRIVRIWPPKVPSADAKPGDWEKAAELGRKLAARAQAAGVQLATEFHRGFLTDTAATASRLAREVNHPAFRTFYQVYEEPGRDPQAELQAILPHLLHVHVYHWRGTERLPLAEGRATWAPLLQRLVAEGRPRSLLLEFVRQDSPEQLVADAATLREWVASAK